MTEVELAYLAGFFDGEGCVLIYHRRDQIGHELIVNVSQTTREPLARFQRAFGGSIGVSRRKSEHHRQTYAWRASSRAARLCLNALRPYMTVKAEQVDVALAPELMWGSPPHLRLPEGVSAKRDEAKYHLQMLKRAPETVESLE